MKIKLFYSSNLQYLLAKFGNFLGFNIKNTFVVAFLCILLHIYIYIFESKKITKSSTADMYN